MNNITDEMNATSKIQRFHVVYSEYPRRKLGYFIVVIV